MRDHEDAKKAGNIIDFEDHRMRRDLRKWASDTGFGVRAGTVKK